MINLLLASAGSYIKEKDLTLTILNGLEPGYLDIATFITGSRMEYDDAYALLLTREAKLEQEHDENIVFNAHYAYAYYSKAFYAQLRRNFRKGGHIGGNFSNVSGRSNAFGIGNIIHPQRMFNSNFRSGYHR